MSSRIPLVRIHCSEVQQVDQLVQKLSHAWQHRWQLLEKTATPQGKTKA